MTAAALLLAMSSGNAAYANNQAEPNGTQTIKLDGRSSLPYFAASHPEPVTVHLEPGRPVQVDVQLENGDYLEVGAGSAAVLSEAGEVGAMLVPQMAGPVDETKPSSLPSVQRVDADTVILSLANGATQAADISYQFGWFNLIDHVDRDTDRGKPRWLVYPSVKGRLAAEWLHATKGWGEVKKKGVPDRSNLYDQYVCHPSSQVARYKSSWNLEEWRPDVGLVKTIAALCNPGGGSD